MTAGVADLEALSVMALANPDLVRGLRTGAAFNGATAALFYAGRGGEGIRTGQR